ncbi:BCL2/adenovirus E1B 19 kDa protein-interacting protein 3-like [Hemicordylus capensis]|uniref:BCL2/adenovirus E1B 19 kDa protein-interacting protein 3-like n=1 Tax=Hemicordylus capensis TaxID=884348 RepID=UPI002302C104|nr:BCL2/adenovirus E1B 19 kDa protein-interacting protein 3-like [Hemicordylus capensis]
MAAPRQQQEDEALHGSWVEVPHFAPEDALGPEQVPTLACFPHGDMEQVLLEAQMEAGRGEGPADSPSLHGRPPPQKTRALGSPPLRSGPLPTEASFPLQNEDPERPLRGESLAWCPASELVWVAPPWAPLLRPALRRKRGVRNPPPPPPPLLLLLVPSLLLSHGLALGLGICIGKRLAAPSASGL